MQDRPNPVELVKTVANFLQATVLPQSTGRQAFEIRIAINALELVARQLACAGEAQCAERQRLEELLGRTGSPMALNQELCARIAEGVIGLTDERLIRHLWATTMEKLAVDQPSYAAFREEQLRNRGAKHGFPSST
jgi:Domain of unknown function (DUF6285)